ncbi:MAG: carboxypeptidase regulatory-like domain-containing protein [Candidatus Micrarchaeota archaeon]
MGIVNFFVEKWDSFLSWSEQRNLPFHKIADALDERGIPSLLVFFILITGLLAGAFFLLQSPTQELASLSLTVKNLEGEPISGASVIVFNSNELEKTLITDSSGKVSFSGLPTGSFKIRVTGTTDVFNEKQVYLTSGTNTVSFSPIALEKQTVSLIVLIDGGLEGDISLSDSSGTNLGFWSGTQASFQVTPFSSFTLSVEKEGYSTVDKIVSVQAVGVTERVSLLAKGSGETQASLFIKVISSEEAVENAQVIVSDSVSNKVFFDGVTGVDGGTSEIKVDSGSLLKISVVADGFEEKVIEHQVIEAENNVEVELSANGSPGNLIISVSEESGVPLQSPIVSLFDSSYSLVSEETPFDGTAEFQVTRGKTYWVSVFKNGFIPASESVTTGSRSISLTRITENNVGSLEISVIDINDEPVDGASVYLYSPEGKPLGYPSRRTSVDGKQTYFGLELREFLVKASFNGRVTQELIDLSEGDESIVLVLEPMQGRVKFVVNDFFEEKALQGAVVKVVSRGETSSCETDSKGVCFVSVLESSDASATVSLSGFETITTDVFEVLPSAVVTQEVSLVSNLVETSSKLLFQGVFDLRGKRVKTLDPFTEYTVKYVLPDPKISFSKARAFVSLSGEAVVTSYDGNGARVTVGSDIPSSSETISSGETIITLNNGVIPSEVRVTKGSVVSWVVLDNLVHKIVAADNSFVSTDLIKDNRFSRVFDSIGSFSYFDSPSGFSGTVVVEEPTQTTTTQEDELKWVDFEFNSFSGSKQLSFRIKTTASNGKIDLSHASVFQTNRGVIRSPEDESQDYSDFNVALTKSASLEISFEGECSGSVCVQYYFEGETKTKNNFEAFYPNEFKLNFKVFSKDDSVVELVPQDDSLQVLNGFSETGELQQLENGLKLSLKKGEASGFFSLKPVKLSKDSSLSFSVSNAGSSITKQLHVSIVSSKGVSLKPRLTPSAVKALEDTEVKLDLFDSLGFKVSGAEVFFGSDYDSIGKREQAIEESEGVYKISLNPSKISSVEYFVRKEGLPAYSGSLNVNPPFEFFTVDSKSIQLSVNSKDFEEAVISLSNKLKQDLRLSLELRLDNAKITDVFLYDYSLKLKAGESNVKTSLLAAIADDVLEVAEKENVLTEKLNGELTITARIGSIYSTEIIPVIISSSFEQENLNSLWSIDESKLDFSLLNPSQSELDSEIIITNEAPYSLLINQEVKGRASSVFPLSLVIPSGEEGVMSVYSDIPSSYDGADCFAEVQDFNDEVRLIASFQGVKSEKKVSVKTSVSQEADCFIQDSAVVTLPVDLKLVLPPSFEFKQNGDGSSAFRVSNEVFLVKIGALAKEGELGIPLNTEFELEQSRVSNSASGWSVSLPVQAKINIPRNAIVTGSSVRLDNYEMVLPGGTPFSEEDGASVALVQANSRVLFKPLSSSGVISTVVPSIIPRGFLIASIPVDSRLLVPFGDSIRTQSDSNYPGFQIITRGSVSLGFSQPAVFDSGSFTVITPSNAKLLLPPGSVSSSANGFIVRFPVQALLVLPPNTPEAFLEKSVYNIRVSSTTTIQTSFQPVFKDLEGRKVIEVPALTPITFTRGVSVTQTSLEDEAGFSKCRQRFSSNEDLLLKLPSYEIKGSEIVLEKCVHVKVLNAEGKELYVSPVAKKITASNYFEDSEGIHVTADSDLLFTTCEKDSKGKLIPRDSPDRMATVIVDSTATLLLPPGTKFNGNKVSLPGLKRVSLIPESGASFDLGVTDKIDFTPKSDSVFSPNELLVELSAGSKLSFIPYCENPSGGIVDVRMNTRALGIKEPKLPFTLTNGKLIDEKTICLQNKGKTVLDLLQPVVSDEITNVIPSDVNSLHFTDLARYGGSQIGPISQDPGIEGCHEYVVTASVPSVLLEKRGLSKTDCINLVDKTVFKGVVTFTGVDSRGFESTVQLPVEVTIDPNHPDCVVSTPADAVKQVATIELSHSFDQLDLVNAVHNPTPTQTTSTQLTTSTPIAASSLSTQSTGNWLGFKNVNHVRWVSLRNGFDEVASINNNNNDFEYMECNTGTELGPGESRLVECTSKKTVSSSNLQQAALPEYDVTLSVPGETPITKTMYVSVGSSDLSLYSATPLGSFYLTKEYVEGKDIDGAWPFYLCESSFCNGLQAADAIYDFTEKTIQYIDALVPDDDSWINLRNKIASEPDNAPKQSFVLLSTPGSGTSLKQYFEGAVASLNNHGYVVSPRFVSILPTDSCGAYEVVVKFEATDDELLSQVKVEEAKKRFTYSVEATKVGECPNNLANAGLFTAPEESTFNVGNKRLHGKVEFIDTSAFKNVKSPADFWEALKKQRIDIGEYSDQPDKEDEFNTNRLFDTWFNYGELDKTPGVFNGGNTKACVKNLMGPLITAAGVDVLGCVGGIIGNVFAPNPVFVNLAYGMCSAFATSTATCLGTNAFNSCEGINNCVSLAFAHSIEGVFNSISPTGALTKGAAALRVGLDAGIQIGVSKGLEAFSPTGVVDDLNPTISYGASKAVQAGGTKVLDSISSYYFSKFLSSESLLSTIASDLNFETALGNELSKLDLETIMHIIRNDEEGFRVFTNKFLGYTGGDVLTPETFSLSINELFTAGDDVSLRNMLFTRIDSSASDELRVFKTNLNRYKNALDAKSLRPKDLKTTKLSLEREAKLIEKKFFTKLDEFIPEAHLSGFKTSLKGKISVSLDPDNLLKLKAGSFVTSKGFTFTRIAVPLAVAALIHVDGRPVQTELNANVNNVVVLSCENTDPSVSKVCFGSGKNCEDVNAFLNKNGFSLSCTGKNKVFWFKDVNKHGLLVILATSGQNEVELFKSIFDPDAPPTADFELIK